MEPNVLVRIKSGTTPKEFAGKTYQAFKETLPLGTRYNVDVSVTSRSRTALGWGVHDWRVYRPDEIEEIMEGEEF